MAGLTLGDIASVVDGRLVDAAADVTVDGPVVIDSREVRPGALFAALEGEHVDGHDYAASSIADGAVAVLATRDVDVPSILVDDVTAALAALARHVLDRLREQGNLTVVGITGSAGKTSVKDMLGSVLSAAGPTIAPQGSFNNELGVPLTVLRADEETRYLVVEMGARGIGHIAHLCRIAPPEVGVVLNVGSAHASEFGSPEATAQAKGELVEALPPYGTAVLNADDVRVAAMAARTAARVASFGRAGEDIRFLGAPELDAQGHPHLQVIVDGEEHDLTVPQLGEHQVVNAAAALAAARAAGVSTEDALASLAAAGAGSPMRMERHVREDGLTVLNDAYNANPESMAAALRTLAAVAPGDRGVAVLGAMLELGDASEEHHEVVGRLAATLGVGRVLVVGDEAAPIARGAGSIAEVVPTADAAIRRLMASLRPDQVVLVKASRGERLERVAEALLAD
ncbi:UDP-N-acetylmuramoyl-tripeptide--D-alanyl-D-alanine ligase [Aeromicrobium camelliae]|uniref:UDP-N-acetylmuramoyl-tripeptide--D-alanyl-D-alanine ligase n=1 Tax=Aeromicrobium camelliae TaxID=1538144 RepID=A0A3N6W6R5_9ACTN|nr:UDP-N-acetylmuramoyl-tripeptide--D-alanyl-D-alanine ligase [Aeromicrobium camelliae]RQN03200.1 UDP-N-acetylmuramoyl-tripeptide--D-alanyl-D-alanine ligase [Aeromicrobium camelliae]